MTQANQNLPSKANQNFPWSYQRRLWALRILGATFFTSCPRLWKDTSWEHVLPLVVNGTWPRLLRRAWSMSFSFCLKHRQLTALSWGAPYALPSAKHSGLNPWFNWCENRTYKDPLSTIPDNSRHDLGLGFFIELVSFLCPVPLPPVVLSLILILRVLPSKLPMQAASVSGNSYVHRSHWF